MKEYKHVFFDWDGCLAMTLEAWFNAVKTSLIHYNVYNSDMEVTMCINDLKNSLKFGLRQEDFIPFTELVYLSAVENTRNIRLYDGALPLLRNLKNKGKQIALITNADSPALNTMLEKTGLTGFFDLVVAGTDVQNRKPHPEGIEKALAALKSEKSSTVMVGDSVHDLTAASNAGIDSILFFPDSHKSYYDITHLRKCNPTYTVRSFSELSYILK